jgi:hypothetical protein
MSELLHFAIDASIAVLAVFGVVELAVFVGAAWITRQEFDFDDERDQ